MPKANTPILSDEQAALVSYDTEYNKMSNALYKPMNQKSRIDTMLESLFGGAIIYVLSCMVINQTYAYVPQYNQKTNQTVYKYDKKRMSDAMLKLIVVVTLVILAHYVVKNSANSQKNRARADMLTDNLFSEYFGGALEKYKTVSTVKFRTLRATSLIINNMPESELVRLRALAVSGLIHEPNAHYHFRKENIDAAIQIISNYIRYNKDIEEAVVQIMKGNEPQTYFLSELSQKTR